MAKGCLVPVLICILLCCIPLCALPVDDGNCVRANALSYVGVHEQGGNNRGFSDYYFRRLMIQQGWLPGYAWCSYFVMAMLNECDVPNSITGWSPSSYNRKDVVFTGGKFVSSYSASDVLVMSLSYGASKERYKGIGHTGIVDRIGKSSIRTIEGNTNQAGNRDSRTGDGVYVKIRPLTKNIHVTRWGKKN